MPFIEKVTETMMDQLEVPSMNLKEILHYGELEVVKKIILD